MKLFSRFFRTAPPPPTPEERIAALSAGSAELILGAELGAGEEELRLAAIRGLPDGDALRRIAGISIFADDSAAIVIPAALERAAQARIAQLIDDGSLDFAGLCDQTENRPAVFSIAALCKDPSQLPQALASIDKPAHFARLVVESPSSRLRQLAAEAIEDPAQLKQLLNKVRGKDKNVYKILKQKSDALHAEERRLAAIAGEIDALCASLERHSHRTYDTLYTSAFEHLHGRWRALTSQPDTAVAQRAEQAIDRCKELIAGHLQQVAAQAARQAAEQAAEDARVRAIRAAQEEAAAQAETEAHRRREAAAARQAEETARAEARSAEEQIFRQIGGLIRKAGGALGEGNTQQAAGLRRAIGEKLPAAAALPPYLARHLQQLDDRLNELRQWKDYAVAPKRIALIEEMESLVGSTEEPKALSERIKSLQQEWRTISKGIVSDAPADWDRFHQASQSAYQPCREYFEAQGKLRQGNLENRKDVLERLRAFEAAQNGENPDWRLLARVIREAPREWRQYSPVDREAVRSVQEDFNGSMDRLQAKLDAWYERNVTDRQSLIKRARHLLAQEDSREAIEAVKQLQILWKETGPAPREQDQPLWSEFRELCDSVYKKRQHAYAEYTAGLEATKVKAVGLCQEAERVAALSGAALLEGAAKIPEWRSAFETLDEMPRAEARGLQDRFRRALDLCEAQIAKQLVRDTEQAFTNLMEAGRRIQAYERAVTGGGEASEREILKQAAETFIASVQQWPKGGLQALKETLSRADSATDADSAHRENALRMLCVRSEIKSETPSPPEDEALRREYQVQRLTQGMGQGIHADDADWDAMVLEWIRIGAVSPLLHESLQSRFMRCRAKRSLQGPERSTFQPFDGGDNPKSRENRNGEMRGHATRVSATR